MAKQPAASDPPTLAYVDGWMERLRQRLPQTTETWDADAIHQCRVSTRRVRAAVDVFRPVLSGHHRKPLERALRKLRRQLGTLRDLDVMLTHLDDLRPSAGRDWLRGRLAEQRLARRDHTADRLRPVKLLGKLGAWWAVRAEWAEAAAAADGLLADAVHLQLDAFAEAATAIDGHDPHAVRIAGKALRYTLEMAIDSGRPLPPGIVRTFKRMQDALGAWHDAAVLAERAVRAAVDAQLGFHDAELHLSVLEVVRGATARSQRHLAAFGNLWQQQGGAITSAIRAAMPLAIAPETGPGPTGSAGTPAPAPPPPADPAGG